MPRVIVNADDFGYTAGVNRAILELFRAGALTSTTLMAGGLALDDALRGLMRRSPGEHTPPGELGVGCHVVLVDGSPVLPSEELATLAPAPLGSAQSTSTTIPQKALFRRTLTAFITDLLRGRIREVEIEQEAIAQIRLLQARGVHVTHLDSHKHTHMFPRVLRPLLRAALQCGVKAIRNPFEPAWSLAATPRAPFIRRNEVRLLSLLRPEFARLVEEAGLHTTSGAIGVLATGTLDTLTLERLFQALSGKAASYDADATWELVCHPGYHDTALAAQSTRLTAARETERTALAALSPDALKAFALIHFGQLSS